MFGTLKCVVPLWTILISICHADLDKPTPERHEWIDDLTFKLSWSWKKPKGLPKDCNFKYAVSRNGTELQRDINTHFQEELLSKSPTTWVYSVNAVGTSSSSCKNRSSLATKIIVRPRKPHGVDRDFKCLLHKSYMNCSWTSDPASPVKLSYRVCGERLNLTYCNVTYTKGRPVCLLQGNFLQTDLCMAANTSNGFSTFKAPKVLTLPNMTISEKGTKLVLTWAPLEVEMSDSLFNICYSVCDQPRPCKEYSLVKEPWEIPYDKSCQYKIQYQVRTGRYSTPIYSDWSEEIPYGFTDRTLTVVAIVIPVIVSACVILSCICFRRHKHIICPEIPDPSSILKEIINGNKEMKPTMYTPAPELVEPIIIVPHIPRSSGPVPT